MRFRFTISRDNPAIIPFPNILLWEQDPLDTVTAVYPWDDVGTSSPSVNLVISSITTTQYLYTDYAFVPGCHYKIDIALTRTDTEFGSNPRTLLMRVFDLLNNQKVTQSVAVNAGPGTYSIEFTAGLDYERFGFRFTSGSDRIIEVDAIDVTITPVESVNEVVIDEPDGWLDSRLVLKRDPVFHSLIEFFEGTFIFYGSNGEVDGGYETILQWEREGGPDAEIRILIEADDEDNVWTTLYEGQFDLSLLEDLPVRMMRLPIIPDNFWAKFMSRKDQPVNLMAVEDLDDESVVTPIEDIDIDLPSQKIRYNGEYHWLDTFTYYEEEDLDFAIVAQLDWDETRVDDVRKFSLPRAIIPIGDNSIWNIVTGIFEAPWDGDYRIEVRLESAYYDPDTSLWVESASTANAPTFRVAVVGSDLTTEIGFGSPSAETLFTHTNVTYGSDVITVSTFDKTLKLFKGQQVAIWGRPGVGVPVDHPENLTVFGERPLTWYTVRLATTGAIVLSGEQIIDGEMTSADLVLVRSQGDPSENGAYTSGAGAWTRLSSLDTGAEFTDVGIYVSEGDTQSNTAWRQTEVVASIGSDAIRFVYMLPSDERLRAYPGTEPQNYFKITADTTFRKTNTQGFLLHDAGAAIINHYGLGFDNPFYSEVLGSDKTLARQYDENGCLWPYAVIRGLQLRGYTLLEKSFAMSFMEWWQGANPIFNLGLGYEYVPEQIISNEGTEQVLLNPDFDDLTAWTGDGVGFPFVIAGGEATVDMPNTNSERLTQLVSTNPGDYELRYKATYSNFALGVDSANVLIYCYDAFDNPIDGIIEFVSGNTTTESSWAFTSVTPVAKVRIRAEVNTGADVTIAFDYVELYAPVPAEDIVIPAEKRIRVEKREYFYQDDAQVHLSNIEQIIRTYDTNIIYKKVLIGYREWKTDDISGIDDPQTKHTYVTNLKKTGEELELLSEFVAASLAIEQARRQSIDKTEDYKYDDHTFIIALNKLYQSDASPDLFLPELDENFVAINNLLNSDTRYNIRLTPGRNFLRNQNWIDGGLQSYIGSTYRFTRGEGNYDLESQMAGGSPDICDDENDGDLLEESQNFHVNGDSIISPFYYRITDHPLSFQEYLTISQNRRNAIGISQTDSDHVSFFIDELTYFPSKGTCNISGWTREYLELQFVESLTPTADCYPESAPLCGDNPITDEFGDPLTDEFGECIEGDGEVDACLGDGLVDELGELITDELDECIYV